MKLKLTKQKIGADKWPFTVTKVYIGTKYRPNALYAFVNGKEYNLNGVAKKGRPLTDIWLNDPKYPGSKKSIQFIFKMCQERGII